MKLSDFYATKQGLQDGQSYLAKALAEAAMRRRQDRDSIPAPSLNYEIDPRCGERAEESLK